MSSSGPPRARLALDGDFSVGIHLTKTPGSCSRSLFAACILKSHGVPTSFLHKVTRTSVLAVFSMPPYMAWFSLDPCRTALDSTAL